ncbi:hypothetical protein [Pontibacter akesuensis]|uniref:SpoIIAA-like n=1 Tax=Pontibacter akesuensis TaxID=388950 RepID=A0A1I7G838_9BACT|nr:hypothetical protein [Pontibacter akesuensis]GHA58283.1 hypothetical protein GCM10007389_07690 [Pontibacter akesuensis]SFU44521.1 hypothetical protein SAMN04487941_0798 [Pontibacter akesuensis]
MKVSRNELLYRESYIVIEHNLEDEWIYVNWRGYVNYDTVTAGCEKILFYMDAKQCFRILNDNTNVEGIWSGASRWVGENWMPRMKQAGMACFAWVYSPSTLSRLSTDKSLRYMEKDVQVETFDDIEAARDWLKLN